MPKVKIFITYKNKHKIIDSKVITPIQTGRAISDEVFSEMIGDDTGDNISYLNTYFCEMSALYWVWKNYAEIGNPDYVGFMHYRRHILFGNKNYDSNFYGLTKFAELNEKYLSEDLTSDENIEKVISQYDIILPKSIDILTNNYEQFKDNHFIDDYDNAIKIIQEKYPSDMKYVEDYNASNLAYFLNMFIMKKELYFRYCEWMFSILFELKNKINYKDRNSQENRAIGYVAERLTGIFLTKLKAENLKYTELPVSFIENTDSTNNEIVPTNDITVAVSCSNEYLPYLSVLLQSIKDNANSANTYVINIIVTTLDEKNKKRLIKQFENSNIHLKFIYLDEKLLHNFQNSCERRHFSEATYARFFIPKLLCQSSKCLYLDLDMIANSDIKDLFDIDFEGKSLVAVRDWVYMAMCYGKVMKDIGKYTKETLKLNRYEDYFQGGVMLLNLDKMGSQNIEEDLVSLFNTLKVKFADQCIFNYYFKNDVKYISQEWNSQINDRDRKKLGLQNYLPIDIFQEHITAYSNPKIFHYSGPYKPWLFPDEEFADIWWSYARKTPFYEEILKKMIEHTINLKIETTYTSSANAFYDVKHYRQNVLKYWKYKLLKNFVWGDTKKRYSAKKEIYKDKIRYAKQFLK